MRPRLTLPLLPMIALACARPGTVPRLETTSASPEVVLADAPATVPLAPRAPPFGNPDAIVDLATHEGAALVAARWRYADVALTAVDGRGPGADKKPTGAPLRTTDYAPKLDAPEAAWKAIEPTALDVRRCGGRVCFGWYRVALTVPERIGATPTTGATIAFEVVVDDYAEVWVDGKLTRELGRTGSGVVKGFNAPNRVVLTHDARPGQSFDVAVFGINGPISASPENFLWVKSATLEVHVKPSPRDTRPSLGRIHRLDPALDAILPPDAKIEKVATGFQFTEGPVWSRAESTLFFSDPNANTIYRLFSDGDLAIFRPKSGYKGADVGRYHQPGSNGLTFDREGRLTINEHGNRRVTRLERNGDLTVLADRYEGKRLNSPNDLVYRSDGTLYFTDPPFGLPDTFRDPRKELPYSGVFRVKDGIVRLVVQDLEGPNGIAFSPDEKYLYVDDWDPRRKVVMRYEVQPDGSVANGIVFHEAKTAGDEALDGMKVDERGDLFVSCADGVRVLSPQGKHLGTIHVAEKPANFAWGDDGKTLYMAAQTSIYRVRTGVTGVRP